MENPFDILVYLDDTLVKNLASLVLTGYIETITLTKAVDRAIEAGMKEGDVITKLEKTAISSMSELLERIQYYEAGETIDVTVKRMGENGYEEKVLQVTLQAKADLDTSSATVTSEDYDEEDDDSDEDYNEDSDDDFYDDLEDFFPKRSNSRSNGFGYFG